MPVNLRERRFPVSADRVGELIDSVADRDGVWPSDRWPAMRLDRGLSVGSAGDGCDLRHTLAVDPHGLARVSWPLAIGPLHDALIGAPSGSVYHRFPSRDHLAAELWLRTAERFQDRFVEQPDADGEPVEVAVAIARGVVDWTVEHPDDAAVLIEFRRSDFISDDGPAPLAHRADALVRQLGAAFDRQL